MPNSKEQALLQELKRVRELKRNLEQQLQQLRPITEKLKMSTLLEILSGSLSYDSSWAIYAKRIDGEFKPESPARFGQTCFENGGILDECEIFMNNQQVCDRRASWFGAFSDGLKYMECLEQWEAAYEQANDDVEWCDSAVKDAMKRCDVIEWAQNNHPDWYEEAYQEWESSNDTEELAYQLIEEANQALAAA